MRGGHGFWVYEDPNKNNIYIHKQKKNDCFLIGKKEGTIIFKIRIKYVSKQKYNYNQLLCKAKKKTLRKPSRTTTVILSSILPFVKPRPFNAAAPPPSAGPKAAGDEFNRMRWGAWEGDRFFCFGSAGCGDWTPRRRCGRECCPKGCSDVENLSSLPLMRKVHF